MVVAVGLTLTGVPLVTLWLNPPGAVITPVPFVNTAVRLELPPEEMEVGLAVKLVMVGTGSTVTVVAAVAGVVPLAPVTVNV
jgi:hypothetical protein